MTMALAKRKITDKAAKHVWRVTLSDEDELGGRAMDFDERTVLAHSAIEAAELAVRDVNEILGDEVKTIHLVPSKIEYVAMIEVR